MSNEEYQKKCRELQRLTERVKEVKDAPPELIQKHQKLSDEVNRISRTHRNGLYLPDANF